MNSETTLVQTLDSDDDSEDDQSDAPEDTSDVSADDQKLALVDDEDDDNDNRQLADPVHAIILHEDKVHYPSANEVYGDEVRTAVLDEDAVMDLNVPLVEPVTTKTNRAKGDGDNDEPDDYIYSDNYLTALFGNETTRVRRGFALVGHLHAGKTTFVDLLLETTKRQRWGDARTSLDAQDGGGPRYADSMESEQLRQMSLVSTPITTILPDTRGKSYVMTLMDCPGHANFHDETVAALRAVDGAVVVLDAVEGIMLHTEMVVRQAISEGLPITLLINKIDRLIVELKLPPRDCYYKLLHLVDSMNELIAQASQGRYPKISPDRGNVTFASAQHGWCFTLRSFAQLYLDHLCEEMDWETILVLTISRNVSGGMPTWILKRDCFTSRLAIVNHQGWNAHFADTCWNRFINYMRHVWRNESKTSTSCCAKWGSCYIETNCEPVLERYCERRYLNSSRRLNVVLLIW
jgi:U5 small nuclear ribonucleoprotein component